MKHATASLDELDRLLVREDGYEQELARTRAAKNLQTVRRQMQEHLHAVRQSDDLSLIIATEKAIVSGDLQRYANSTGMRSSLTTAMTEFGVIEAHLSLVADPAQYRTVDAAHSLKKNRRTGLPNDEARQALASHAARLRNLDKSRLSDNEKAVLNVRSVNVGTAHRLYEKQQAEALGVDLSRDGP